MSQEQARDRLAPPLAGARERPRPAHYLVLLAGVLVVAAASIMIRQAQRLGMPSPTIATLRLGIAALVVLPLALVRARGELLGLTRRELLLGLGAGACLAAHFFCWILSLEYTSVASSSALVTTSPLWLGLAAWLMRERLARATWAGALLTMLGSAAIGLSDSGAGAGSNALLGDGLALLGAIAIAAYFLVGRALQRRHTTLVYVAVVYSSAAIFALVLALATVGGGLGAVFGGYPAAAYLMALALALGPQLLGHTTLNWSLRHLSPTFVGVATLGEPIGAALLALLIFGQQFAPWQLVGFVVLMAGIVIAARGESAAPAAD